MRKAVRIEITILVEKKKTKKRKGKYDGLNIYVEMMRVYISIYMCVLRSRSNRNSNNTFTSREWPACVGKTASLRTRVVSSMKLESWRESEREKGPQYYFIKQLEERENFGFFMRLLH